MHLHVCADMHTCMPVCEYVCLQAWTCIYMCVSIHTHAHVVFHSCMYDHMPPCMCTSAWCTCLCKHVQANSYIHNFKQQACVCLPVHMLEHTLAWVWYVCARVHMWGFVCMHVSVCCLCCACVCMYARACMCVFSACMDWWESGGWQAAPCSRPRLWEQLIFSRARLVRSWA